MCYYVAGVSRLIYFPNHLRIMYVLGRSFVSPRREVGLGKVVVFIFFLMALRGYPRRILCNC